MLTIDADGIVHGPNVVTMLLPEAQTQPSIVPWSIIFHTNGGAKSATAAQLDSYAARADVGTEPHLDVQLDGLIAQFMPFTVRADCNSAANRFSAVVAQRMVFAGAIAIETQDEGAATVDATPWTPAQLESLTQVAAVLAATYGIPVVRTPTWDGRGMAPHNAFSNWSSAAHSCPGKARTAQMPALLARVTEVLTPPPVPQTSPPAVQPPGGEPMMTLFQPIDCDAEFLGMTDVHGVAQFVEWIEGTPGAIARRDAHIAAGARVDKALSLGGLINCTLIGPLPVGDSRHSWTGGEFARVVS
jgi:hypothetical protein